jgi:hypothetical protein
VEPEVLSNSSDINALFPGTTIDEFLSGLHGEFTPMAVVNLSQTRKEC